MTSAAGEAPPVTNQLFSLAKHSVIYGLGGAAMQLLGVITLPVFARTFTTAEYGVLEVAVVSISALLTLVEFGMATAAQRSYFDYRPDQVKQRQAVLFTAISASTALACTLSALLLIWREPIADWLFGESGYTDMLVLAALTLPVANLAFFGREVMRLNTRAWQYVASSLVGAGVGVALALFAVLVLGAGVESVVLGNFVGHALATVYGLAVARRDLALRFSRPDLRVMLAYGLPLIPAAMAMWALQMIDRIMLGKLSDLEQVGEYAVANRLASLLLLGVTAFSVAFVPFAMRLHGEDPQAERVARARIFTLGTAALLGAGLAITLFARELLFVVAPKFDSSYEAVGLLTLAVALLGTGAISSATLSLTRRTKYFPVYTGIAAALNIALNVVLIPTIGMLGAALATALAYGVLNVLYYSTAQRVDPAPFELAKVLKLMALALAIGALGAVPVEPLGLSLGVKALALSAFVAALFALDVVRRADLEALAPMVPGALRRRESGA